MFSQNLQKLRNSKNISQEQLADKIGVSRQSISAWESGKSSPELEKLVALSELFEVSLDELTGEIRNTNSTFEKKEYEKTYQKIALLRASGMFILFAGIALAAYLSNFKVGEPLVSSTPTFSVLAGISIMLALAISIPLLILANNFDKLSNEDLAESGLKIDQIFSKNEIKKAETIKNSGAIALVAVLFTALATHQIIYHFSNLGENTASAVFMILLGAGIAAATYGNTIFAKINNFYEIENRNEEKDAKIGTFAAITMLGITATFLVYSFITSDWASARIFYPVGGIAIAIFAIFVNRKK